MVRKPGSIVLLVAVVGLSLSRPVPAQEAVLKMSRPPHYAGEPVVIVVEASGFDGDPECIAPEVSDGQLLFEGTSSVGSFELIINGRRTSRRTLSFQYSFTADAPGRYSIGPFTVKSGGQKATTQRRTLRLAEIPLSRDVRIRLVLPEKPLFVGQRVPIQIEWWLGVEPERIARDRELLLGSSQFDFSRAHVYIRSPLFRLDAFDFIDAEPTRRDLVLPIITSEGRRLLKAKGERNRAHEGRSYYVFTAERTLVPLRAGEFVLEPASVTVALVMRRNVFRDPMRVERIRALDLERRLIVKEPPLADRPESYAGAVGSGFGIEVTADRTVLRSGDPITLTVTLTGDGNLENASLPPLSELANTGFRLSEGDVAGIYSEEERTKQFTVPVRVLSESVTEIPPLAYSWFNVDSMRYETTHSKPIALSVSRAEVVGPDQVVQAAGAPDAGPAAEEPERRFESESSRPTFTFVGADLTVVTDAARILRSEANRFGGRPTIIWLYSAPLALLALAIVGRRRASVDPAVVARRKALAAEHKRVAKARGLPTPEATAEIASALRVMISHVPGARSEDLEQFLAECETIVYAPEGQSAQALDDAFHRRAVEFADGILARAKP